MCDDRFRTFISTNILDYLKKTQDAMLIDNGFDIGIEVEEDGNNEGFIPALTKLAWTKNEHYERLVSFLTGMKGGAISVSQAFCVSYKVEISQFLTPSFHPAFLGVLKYMEKQTSEVRQLRAFKKFIRDYGTHFLSASFLGNKISSYSFFNSFEKMKNGREKIGECGEIFAYKILGIDMGKKSGSKDNEDDKKMKRMEEDPCQNLTSRIYLPQDELIDRTEKSIFGNSVPKKGLEKWSEEKTKMLIPIKYQLSPIINLFTPENMDERYNVSSSTILKWFLPFYMKYCKVFEIQCFSPSGCGYDDTCTFEEQCIEDRSSATNYRCEASSWADITNWPAMGTNTVKDPDPPNITWFREHDSDSNGYLSLAELYAHEYPSQGWLGRRYTEAIDKLFGEADLNGDRYVDNGEYIKLHERHPWYSEQIAFLIINSDNDGYLTRGEFFEATKSSPDIQTMNFSYKQLENLVDGLIAIGDDDGDERISFSEYVKMSNDVFVDHFAPKYLKKVFKS
ncbi:uncharacterized protein [Lepeophtheirus salmonis]|uniref:uncharacterized protein n=1 Tax=Lepeophtheirus salmonis TaxID=72036 RepID=UPI003AF39938